MPAPQSLEQYRSYLILLARAQVGQRPQSRVDASDIVQQTLLEAHQRLAQLRGEAPAQRASWLRQILANNLADAWRNNGRAKRDASRERSLEDQLACSSVRLGEWLAAEQSAPGDRLDREERAVRLAQAIAQLPEAQQEALVQHYWQGRTLAEIAGDMNRTPAAVAGLLKRGLKQLRELMSEVPEP